MNIDKTEMKHLFNTIKKGFRLQTGRKRIKKWRQNMLEDKGNEAVNEQQNTWKIESQAKKGRKRH